MWSVFGTKRGGVSVQYSRFLVLLPPSKRLLGIFPHRPPPSCRISKFMFDQIGRGIAGLVLVGLRESR